MMENKDQKQWPKKDWGAMLGNTWYNMNTYGVQQTLAGGDYLEVPSLGSGSFTVQMIIMTFTLHFKSAVLENKSCFN